MIYHLGVLARLREQSDMSGWSFGGASSGSVVGAIAATGVDVSAARDFVVRMAKDAQRRRFGPAGKMTRYVRGGLEQLLPTDAHERASGRLLISITTLPRLEPLLVDRYASRCDLIRAVLASCYIPLYYERPVRFRGRFCIDGGLTDNLPKLDDATLTVSPQPGDYDYCPDEPVPRRYGLLPPDTDTLNALFESGYRTVKGA